MNMWALCEKYPAYYNLQHSVTYNSDVQWNILIQPLHTYTLNLSSQNRTLLNKYWQRYHIKLYDFPGERGKFSYLTYPPFWISLVSSRIFMKYPPPVFDRLSACQAAKLFKFPLGIRYWEVVGDSKNECQIWSFTSGQKHGLWMDQFHLSCNKHKCANTKCGLHHWNPQIREL